MLAAPYPEYSDAGEVLPSSSADAPLQSGIGYCPSSVVCDEEASWSYADDGAYMSLLGNGPMYVSYSMNYAASDHLVAYGGGAACNMVGCEA